MQQQESASTQDANSLPKRTTPTWDMELLLSGATVFALFQGAQALMSGGAYLMPRLQGDLLTLFGMLFTYGYGGLILLALTFALHLVIRAYWVAMVGMNSVYPHGIKLDALKAGPLAKALLTERMRSMDESIERADNAATIVFGIGVSIVMVLVPVSLVVTLMFGMLGLVGWITGLQAYLSWMMLGLTTVVFVPYFLLSWMDKRRGDQLAPGTRPYRLIRGGLSAYANIGLSRAANPLVTVFSSNIGEGRGQLIIFTVMLTAMLSSTVGLFLSQKELGVGSYAAFPDPRRGMPASVEGRGYASSQQRDGSPSTPYLPGMVARGNYLRLVVPYVPNFHGDLMRTCQPRSELHKVAEERARRIALLACFSRGVLVTLDGQKISTPPEWYTEPDRDLRGLLYMIPIKALAEGRHEVSVLAEAKLKAEPGADPEQPFIIPFWR